MTNERAEICLPFDKLFTLQSSKIYGPCHEKVPILASSELPGEYGNILTVSKLRKNMQINQKMGQLLGTVIYRTTTASHFPF